MSCKQCGGTCLGCMPENVDVPRYERQSDGPITATLKEIRQREADTQRLRERVAALEAALKRYGQHEREKGCHPKCWGCPDICECGLYAVLYPAQDAPTGAETAGEEHAQTQPGACVEGEE